MTTIAIIQARTGSTRLPGKVMLDLSGKSMLVRGVERIQKSKLLDNIVIATTTKPADNKIVELCKKMDWDYYCGNEEDVLDRYYYAAKEFQAKNVVRITSDCPLIEPAIIDQIIEKFLKLGADVDYISNVFPVRTYPRGLDTEMMSFSCLERCWKEDLNPAYREHVTQYIQHNPKAFKIREIHHLEDLSFMRWTVDTSEDLEFVRKIFSHFRETHFSWTDILEFLQKNPSLMEINKHIQQKQI
jgi:spore coat polysaccharide biosynthesis protein SpsF